MKRPLITVAAALFAVGLVGQSLEVAITAPDYGAVTFGATRVAAVTYPVDAHVERLEFYLDGVLVATDRERPFEVEIDIGQENRQHRIEVVARGADGASGSASISTGMIYTDDEVAVELRQLFVTVSRNGQRITDLPREAFSVFDDGERQSLVTFAGGEVPFSAALVVDASRSMSGGKLQTAIEGAGSFLGGMRQLDEAMLILFSDRVVRETPFSSFPRLVLLGLRDVAADGGSAIHDALYIALKRLTPRLSRKVIVLLTDGEDVESALPMSQVQAVLRREQAVVYWIRLGGGARTTDAGRWNNWRDLEQNRSQYELLTEAVVESGGRIVDVAGVDAVGDAFGAILSELRDQYVLGYYPSSERGPGAWHRVQVRVDARADVRVRSGYLER